LALKITGALPKEPVEAFSGWDRPVVALKVQEQAQLAAHTPLCIQITLGRRACLRNSVSNPKRLCSDEHFQATQIIARGL